MQTRPIPSVSVVMPAYNAARYLREAIDSILAQTYRDFEFIIINDGSTDGTREIIQSYTDPRIVYLENEVNSGICVTLNKGLDAARGRYIARMDADDISLPHRLATQVAYMDAHPETIVCGSKIQVFGDGIETYITGNTVASDLCTAGLLFNPCIAHPSVIWRSDVMKVNKLRYEDEYRGLEDFRLWWRFAQLGKLNVIDNVLLKYRIHKNQVTQNIPQRKKEKSNEFRKERYESFGFKLSEIEQNVVNKYSYGDFKSFDKVDFSIFLSILGKIVKSDIIPIKTTRQALKIECGRALAYTINNSPYLRKHKIKYLTNAFLKGVVTFKWYLKFIYYSLI